jgi:hypothetical protein
MSKMPIRTGSGIFRLITFGIIVVLVLQLVPSGLAASNASEDVISIQFVSRPPDILQEVTTRLIVPAQAHWETDPDAGPLTFTVETGALSVQLGGGLARIERRSNLLIGEHISPLSPGRAAVLSPGDRLVVVRGFQLAVTNDGQMPATAIVVRLRQAPVDPRDA